MTLAICHKHYLKIISRAYYLKILKFMSTYTVIMGMTVLSVGLTAMTGLLIQQNAVNRLRSLS